MMKMQLHICFKYGPSVLLCQNYHQSFFLDSLKEKCLVADWPYTNIHKTIVEKNLKTRAVFSNKNLKSHKMVG